MDKLFILDMHIGNMNYNIHEIYVFLVCVLFALNVSFEAKNLIIF